MLKGKLFFISFSLCFCSFAVLMSGCAGLKEGTKGFLGVSTRALEEVRKGAITEDFNYDYFTCYSKTLDALKEIRAYVYTKDIKKQMIAVYVSEINTTAVGVFFKDIDQNKTRIEVVSRSLHAKELIAGKLFAALKGKPVSVK